MSVATPDPEPADDPCGAVAAVAEVDLVPPAGDGEADVWRGSAAAGVTVGRTVGFVGDVAGTEKLGTAADSGAPAAVSDAPGRRRRICSERGACLRLPDIVICCRILLKMN